MTHIKNIIKNMNLLSIYDIDALTYHELVYAIGDRLMDCIKDIIKINEHVDDKILEMEKTLDSLLTSKLSDEVLKQLIEWRDNGTLEEIVSISFNKLKPIVDALEKSVKSIFINVLDYGAKNDGTNTTEQIQKALDKILESPNGGTVYFPSGDYLCDNLTVHPNTTLKGETQTTRLISNDIGLLDVIGDNITIDSITLDGNSPNNLCKHLIYSTNTAKKVNINISNCILHNLCADYTYAIELENLSELSILNNKFDNLKPLVNGGGFIKLSGGIEKFVINHNKFGDILSQPDNCFMIKTEEINNTVESKPYNGEIIANVFKGSANNMLNIIGADINIKGNTFHLLESYYNNKIFDSMITIKNSEYISFTNNILLSKSDLQPNYYISLGKSHHIVISDLIAQFQGDVVESFPTEKRFINAWDCDYVTISNATITGKNYLDIFIQLRNPGFVDIKNISYRDPEGGVCYGVYIRDKGDKASISISDFELSLSKITYPIHTTVMDESINAGYLYLTNVIFRGSSGLGTEPTGTYIYNFNLCDIKNCHFDRCYAIDFKNTKHMFIANSQLPNLKLYGDDGYKLEIRNNIFKCAFASDYAIQMNLDNGSYNIRSINNFIQECKTYLDIQSKNGMTSNKKGNVNIQTFDDQLEFTDSNTRFIKMSSNIDSIFWDCIQLKTNQSLYGFNYGVTWENRNKVRLAHNTLFAHTNGSRMFMVGNNDYQNTNYYKEILVNSKFISTLEENYI